MYNIPVMCGKCINVLCRNNHGPWVTTPYFNILETAHSKIDDCYNMYFVKT